MKELPRWIYHLSLNIHGPTEIFVKATFFRFHYHKQKTKNCVTFTNLKTLHSFEKKLQSQDCGPDTSHINLRQLLNKYDIIALHSLCSTYFQNFEIYQKLRFRPEILAKSYFWSKNLPRYYYCDCVILCIHALVFNWFCIFHLLHYFRNQYDSLVNSGL